MERRKIWESKSEERKESKVYKYNERGEKDRETLNEGKSSIDVSCLRQPGSRKKQPN